MGQTMRLDNERGNTISGWLCEAEGEPRGSVVIAQEIFGVNAHIRAVTERFARAGYTALAPAFFDHVEAGMELDYDESGFARGRELALKLDVDEVVADVRAAARAVASAGKTAVVGYCWGGTTALVSGLRLDIPAVSYYGSRNVNYLDEPATAPLQFHFGERDKSIPAAVIERHRQAYPDAEIYTYPAGHGFNCDLREGYDAESASLAWHRTLDFLLRHL